MQKDLNITQWKHEIATFVDETKRQLSELQTILSKHLSEDSSRVVHDSLIVAEPQAVKPVSVDQQLANLHQTIARRLQEQTRADDGPSREIRGGIDQ